MGNGVAQVSGGCECMWDFINKENIRLCDTLIDFCLRLFEYCIH